MRIAVLYDCRSESGVILIAHAFDALLPRIPPAPNLRRSARSGLEPTKPGRIEQRLAGACFVLRSRSQPRKLTIRAFFFQYRLRGAVTRQPRNPPAGMRAGAAEIEAVDRGSVVSPSGNGPHKKHLIQRELRMIDMTFRQAELVFQIQWRQNLPCQ